MVGSASGAVLAIVPARGGSKSIPRKNVRSLAGHPLVAYSIAAGLTARLVSRVLLSTDDPEIAEVGRRYGAEVPFLRPRELALDDTPDLPVFEHALSWLKEHEGFEPELVVQLRPTSPLRPPGLVDQAIDLLARHPSADSVRSVTLPTQNPYKMWRRTTEGFVQPLLEAGRLREPYNMPRQALPEVWWQTGHVDAVRLETIARGGSLTGVHVLPVPVDRSYAVDIDTDADWNAAESLLIRAGHLVVLPGGVGASASRVTRRKLPPRVSLLVLDFDGVLTDDRVWVAEDGQESVACSRSDGYGLDEVQRAGVEVIVLSRERNPVVRERCRKLGISCHQAIVDKKSAFDALVADRATGFDEVVYVGNDVTDLECLASAACGVVVADAHPLALAHADLVLTKNGGAGAVRELCDLLVRRAGGSEMPR